MQVEKAKLLNTCGIVLVLAGVGVAPAAAQGVVPAGAQPGDVAASVQDRVVVTATGESTALVSTKTETPLIETPQSISVITREEMDVRAVHTVADALSYSAGVQAEAAGIDSRVDEVSVRGFGAGGFSSNNNFVDGLRLPSGGMWTRPAFDPFGLQQVDVLKGPSSVLYGQVAPGGIVNLVSKRPSATAKNEILVQSAGYADFDRWQHQVAGDFGGAIGDGGALLYRVVGLARDGETQIDQTKNSRYYFSPSLSWQVSDATEVTFLAQYQQDRGGSTYQFLPALGTLNASAGRRIDPNDFLGEPDWNRFDRDQYLGAVFVEHDFTDALKLRVNGRYTHIESLYRATVLAGNTLTACGAIAGCTPGQTISRRAVQGEGETDGWAIDAQLQAKFETGPLSHTVLIGADHFDTEWGHYRDGVAAALVLPILNIFNPVPRGSATYGANVTPQVYGEMVSDQTGLYVQDQISAGKWRFALGGRYDTATDKSFNPLNGARTTTESDADTWSAGAVYLFDVGLAPYFSYAESFLPSPGTTWEGSPFEPTTGQQVEAGIRYQAPGSNAYFTVGAYEITQQNVTTPDPDLAHICNGGRCSVQTGEGLIRGVEIEGRATLPFGLAAIGTFTRTDAKITRTNTLGQVGNRLPQTPDKMASLFLDYRFDTGAMSGLGLGGGVRYIGDSVGDTANTLLIPDYTLFDLFVRYELGALNQRLDGAVLSLNARNLADETYVATCNTVASCYYGSGRAVTARIQYRW